MAAADSLAHRDLTRPSSSDHGGLEEHPQRTAWQDINESERGLAQSSTPMTSATGSVGPAGKRSWAVRLVAWLGDDTYYPHPAPILLLHSFATGMLDVFTISKMGTFASNMTGNVIFLSLKVVNIPVGARASNCLIALGSFWLGVVLNSLLSLRYSPPFSPSSSRPRRRWVLLLTFSVQCLILLLASSLIYGGAIDLPRVLSLDEPEGKDDRKYLILLTMLAMASGAQAASCRPLSPKGRTSPITTVVVTSAMFDFFSDPQLFFFTTKWAKRNWARDDRFLFVIIFFLGGLAGGGIQKGANAQTSLMVAAAIKSIPIVLVALAGTEEGYKRKREERARKISAMEPEAALST